ncbi:lipid II flippase MurJ [Apilactobacillus kunkeei]|nr:lipid II flippase MurJ [Apilactobacillus kunkeei]CAI2648577.1 lipid II flippase MurJ [Apilactobacillus kunkeei]CAI2803182.1 lipid II flippase MurJ [Apilactobacillus kunkeei]
MLFISFVFFIVFLFFADKSMTHFYIAQSVTIIATIMDISWFFMGIENFGVIVFKNFAIKIFMLLCIFKLVTSQNDLIIYIYILSLSLLLGNLSMFPNLRKVVGTPFNVKLNIFKHFMPSLFLFIPEIATQVYVMLNKTMLGIIISVQSSGYYDQSDKVVKLVLAVVTATGTVMLPHVANAFANGKYEKTKEFLYDSFTIVTSISVPMFFGLSAISSKLVPLFFSPKFNMVIPLMQIESVVIVLIAWSNVIGVQYLLPTKQNKKYTTSIVCGALINIVMNIPLILLLGSIGAIISTVISEVVVAGYQFISIKKQVSLRTMFSEIYKYIIAGLIMFVVVYSMNEFLSVTWTSLIIEVIVGMLIYGLAIVVFRANVFSVVKKIKNS